MQKYNVIYLNDGRRLLFGKGTNGSWLLVRRRRIVGEEVEASGPFWRAERRKHVRMSADWDWICTRFCDAAVWLCMRC